MLIRVVWDLPPYLDPPPYYSYYLVWASLFAFILYVIFKMPMRFIFLTASKCILLIKQRHNNIYLSSCAKKICAIILAMEMLFSFVLNTKYIVTLIIKCQTAQSKYFLTWFYQLPSTNERCWFDINYTIYVQQQFVFNLT